MGRKLISFEERAKKFGHDLSALKSGDVIRTTRYVQSIEELRDLLHDGASDQDRQKRIEDYQQSRSDLMDESNTTMEAVYFRAEAAVFSDKELNHDDQLALEHIFPVEVDLMSADDMTVDYDWVLGTEGQPFSVNLGTLTLEPGGSITAYATAVNFTAETFINKVNGAGTGDAANYTIGIFGVDGAAGIAGYNPSAGEKGYDGRNSSPNSPGVCTGSTKPTDGGPGQAGANGGNGQIGQDGKLTTPLLLPSPTLSKIPYMLSPDQGLAARGAPAVMAQQVVRAEKVVMPVKPGAKETRAPMAETAVQVATEVQAAKVVTPLTVSVVMSR